MGQSVKIYQEFDKGGYEFYGSSVMDSRSFGTPATGRSGTIGELYNNCGLYCTPASGKQNADIVPVMKDWLRVDMDRPHIMYQLWKHKIITDALYKEWMLDRKTHMGGSRLYFVADLHFVFSEINAWAYKKDSDVPESKDDHIIGAALKYVIAEDPMYTGNLWDQGDAEEEVYSSGETEEHDIDHVRSRMCGY